MVCYFFKNCSWLCQRQLFIKEIKKKHTKNHHRQLGPVQQLLLSWIIPFISVGLSVQSGKLNLFIVWSYRAFPYTCNSSGVLEVRSEGPVWLKAIMLPAVSCIGAFYLGTRRLCQHFLPVQFFACPLGYQISNSFCVKWQSRVMYLAHGGFFLFFLGGVECSNLSNSWRFSLLLCTTIESVRWI